MLDAVPFFGRRRIDKSLNAELDQALSIKTQNRSGGSSLTWLVASPPTTGPMT
jgi:hypothetical protein